LKTYDNEEKRRRVIELRKEGWTIRKIAKELKMSSRTVIEILKDDSAKEDQEESVRKAQEHQYTLQANYTRALSLLKDGKSLLDVTIELGVMAEETEKAFIDFWKLMSIDDFRRSYENIQPYIVPLLNLWYKCIEKGLDMKDAFAAIEYAKDRAKAERELQFLTNKLADMKNHL
jgi:transcriptional regulator with XRE-family HTH domain